MEQRKWLDKPYNNLDAYLKKIYGHKIYKIAIDGGCTCPNRDGVIGTGGCIFCSKGGSGEYAAPFNKDNPSVLAQLEAGRELIISKMGASEKGYIAYFQPYSNTYAPVDYLRKLYTEALDDEECVGLSIATRPDCLPDEVIYLLDELCDEYPDKFIWVELGLQTIHRTTAELINRGYDLSVFEDAVRKLTNISIPIIVHMILGLPGETPEMMLAGIEYLNTFPIFGIKLQLLHVLRDTKLESMYNERLFDVLTQEEYTDILIKCLEKLCPDIVVHRVTGDGPSSQLIAPLWSLNKKNVLNTLLKEMKERNTWQGRLYENSGFFNVI